MEALQQQWDNSSAAMEGMAAEDKRLKKHVARLQNQTEVRQLLCLICCCSIENSLIVVHILTGAVAA
jgi:hypothetical protein